MGCEQEIDAYERTEEQMKEAYGDTSHTYDTSEALKACWAWVSSPFEFRAQILTKEEREEWVGRWIIPYTSVHHVFVDSRYKILWVVMETAVQMVLNVHLVSPPWMICGR